MRLGPLDIRLAEKRPPPGELGATGTSISPSAGGVGSGLLTEEDYNPDLAGEKLYKEIDRMRMSDSQVRAALTVIKLPLMAADWTFEAPTDSPKDKEISEWLELQLLTKLRHPWVWTLRHILLHLDFGTMPFEMVWDVADDPMLRKPMITLKDLAPRMPKTITEWRLDDEGQLAGIVQQVSTAKTFSQVTIPAEKLLVFVNEQEGSNYRGISVLRAARKDWILKERAQRINAIRLEKRGVGMDVGTISGTASATRKSEAEQVLMTIRAHERAYVVETDDFKYRVEGGCRGSVDVLPTVKYHDLMILRGVLAEFLAMGGDSSGSLAMHRDKSSFFLMALGAIARQIEGTINRELVPKWVSWNWPDVKEYPELTHSRLDRRDVSSLAEGLAKLVPIGALTADPGLEKELRTLLEMPEKEKMDEPPISSRLRRKTARHSLVADFVAMKKGLESAEREIVRDYQTIQKRQIARLVDEAMKAITAGNPDKLRHISVPFKQEAAEKFAGPLEKLYRQGQKEVVKELVKSGAGLSVRLATPLDPAVDKDVAEFLVARSRAVASSLAERLRGSMLRHGLDQIRRGTVDKDSLAAKLSGLSENNVKREARATTSEALNLGRQSTAKKNQNRVTATEYSALMDNETCGPCGDLDGQAYVFDSPEAAEVEPPYKLCEGGGNCRCVFIYTFASEGPEEAPSAPPIVPDKADATAWGPPAPKQITPAQDKAFTQWIVKMTKAEAEAADHWKRTGYRSMRSHQIGGGGSAETVQSLTDFGAALAKAPNIKAPLYRGISDLSDEAILKLGKAKRFKLNADTSFSLDAKIAGEFAEGTAFGAYDRVTSVIMEIRQGAGRLISTRREKEVLLRKGESYRIVERNIINKVQDPYGIQPYDRADAVKVLRLVLEKE